MIKTNPPISREELDEFERRRKKLRNHVIFIL